MHSIRLFATIFIFIISNSSCAANQDTNIRIIKRPVNRIAIDPGLGGAETGPTGCIDKVFSKDINLKISKKLAEKVKSDLGIDAVLTRETDKHVSLEERTVIANARNADLFISIHVNSFNDPKVHGIETFYPNFIVDSNMKTPAIKNKKEGSKTLEDIDAIQQELMQQVDRSESRLLAEVVQNSIVNILETKYDNIKNRGVKNAPLYVLIGASMPAIVVYPSFITNTQECMRLMTEEYQEAVAAGIVEGIRNYLKKDQ
jgi:N-acetylmuramoyl-L-alanine amidase